MAYIAFANGGFIREITKKNRINFKLPTDFIKLCCSKESLIEKTKTKKIDVSFSICDPDLNSHYFDQNNHLIENFGIKNFFPMHNKNENKESKLLAEMLKAQGVKTTVNCIEVKGDKFNLNTN